MNGPQLALDGFGVSASPVAEARAQRAVVRERKPFNVFGDWPGTTAMMYLGEVWGTSALDAAVAAKRQWPNVTAIVAVAQ